MKRKSRVTVDSILSRTVLVVAEKLLAVPHFILVSATACMGNFKVSLVRSKRCLPGFWFEQQNGCPSLEGGCLSFSEGESAGIRMRR